MPNIVRCFANKLQFTDFEYIYSLSESCQNLKKALLVGKPVLRGVEFDARYETNMFLIKSFIKHKNVNPHLLKRRKK